MAASTRRGRPCLQLWVMYVLVSQDYGLNFIRYNAIASLLLWFDVKAEDVGVIRNKLPIMLAAQGGLLGSIVEDAGSSSCSKEAGRWPVIICE